MSASFNHICRTTFSTKRVPAISGGKGGVPVDHLANKKCTDPIQPGNSTELLLALNLDTRYQLYEIHTDEPDIKHNPPDVIVINGNEYPVVIAEPRSFLGAIRTRVVYKNLVR